MQYPVTWDSRFTLLLTAFNDHCVDYLLIGSMAKSHYNQQVSVGDMDLLVDCTLETVRRVEAAFRDRDYYHLLQCDLAKLAEESKRIELTDTDGGNKIGDILTPKPGFRYCDAVSRAIDIEVDCIPVRIASERDLKTIDALSEQGE